MSAEVKPGYKMTEVGVIPEDWSVVSMDAITSHIGDGLHGTPVYSPNGNYFFINGNNLNDGKIVITSDTKSVDHSEFIKHQKPISERSILISINGTIGKLGLFDSEQVLLGKSAAFLNVKPKISKRYVYQSLKTQIVKQQFFDGLTGSTIGNLGLSTIRRTKVPLPPMKAEQEAIAEALSNADALIESLEQLITKKRQIKQGAMQEMLTGKKRLPGFSGEWEVKKLGDLFSFSGGYSASRDQLSSEGHCYLHYGDIHGSSKMIIDAKDDYQNIPKLNIPLKRIASNSLLEDGDVVFVDASEDDEGTSKYIVIVNKDDTPFIAGLHTIVAKSMTSELTHEYRRYCFQTADIHQQFLFFAVGTKVSGISKSNIPKLTLPVPLYPEQAAIAEILMDMDSEIDAQEVKLEKARKIKYGMMHNLLTGKIRLM